MSPEQFIAKWQAADLTERAAAQAHFNDLCRCSTLSDDEIIERLFRLNQERANVI